MCGLRGQVVVLSVAIAFSVSLGAQQHKSSPANKHRSAPITDSESPVDLNRDTTFTLLLEAYNSSRDLPSEQRIPLLSEICEVSASLNSSRPRSLSRGDRIQKDNPRKSADLTKKQRDKLRDWAEELFQLGSEFPSGSQLRAQAQVAAARSIVSADPKRAMELLDSVDAGPATNGPDSRWSVASALFTRLYDAHGAAAFPEIRREALSLGDRGAYPYFAISSLLNQVHGNTEITRQFFADAVDYFRRSNTSRAQVFGLMTMLDSDQVRNQLQPWQVQDAASQVVGQVKDYVRMQTELQPNSEAVDPNIRAFLQFLKSSMKRFAPEIAAQLPDSADFPSNAGSRLLSVNARRKTPQAPAPDDSMKALQKEFAKSRTTMMKLGEDEIHEGSEMQQIIDRTVTLGTELAERTVLSYAPEDHAYAMLISTAELSGVARLGAHINPAATLAAIRQIQNDEIKTKLLLSVARTIRYLH